MDSELATRRRSEIIGAALKVFSDKGYHAAKIEDIASELNMGHGTFYRYFQNKLDIFNHVVLDVVHDVTSIISDINPDGADNIEEYRRQLEEIGDNMFGLFKKNPQIARILFYEAFRIDDEDMQRWIHGVFDLFGGYTEMFLRNGIRKEYFRADLHVRESALAINATLFEAFRRVVSSSDPDKELKVWKETIISLIIDGLKA